jgi:hypothetical protein
VAVNSLLIADITSLQWRAFVNGAVNLPYVLNAFVAGYISSGINAYSADGWRWGVGSSFCCKADNVSTECSQSSYLCALHLPLQYS